MAEPLRFHLDENVPVAIAEALRRRGIDVTTTQDANLLGADDAAQLRFCLRQRRVLVTQDMGFVRLHREGAEHAGVACCALGTRTIGEMVRSLALLHGLLTAEEMVGEVEYL